MSKNYNPNIEPDLASLVVEQMICFVITDLQGRYVYGNAAWQDLMGVSLEELKGRRVRDIVPNTKIDEAINRGKVLTGTVSVNNRPAFSFYIPIYDNNGVITAGAIITILIGSNNAEYFRKTEQLIEELNYYKAELCKVLGAKYSIDNIVGLSPAIMQVKEYIELAAQHRSHVLIQGETGSGKELVAHAIHNLSVRRSEPFVKVNCASIPENLMESIFFGYEEGSFTGAKKKGHIGKFEQANKGTIFLDEISELPLQLQPKLLRVLQEKEIERIGGSTYIPIDVRLITCSNIPLEKLVQDRLFRSDLFYRINVITINVPPLRERMEDIGLIADALLHKLNDQMGLQTTDLSEEIIHHLKDYNWPGNVRELENSLEYAMNMANGSTLQWKDFSGFFENRIINSYLNAKQQGVDSKIRIAKGNLERDMIADTLHKVNNNKSAAAKKLGISRTMLYKKLRQYGL